MINLGTLFWVLVAFFAVIGMMRGWTREVIATSSLVLSLFALNQFGFFIVSILGATADTAGAQVDLITIRRQQFYILSGLHLLITFFGYQGPTFAGSRLSERLRVRDSLQDKLLGLIVGAVNGYLILGTIWSFLEYQVTAGSGWVPLAADMGYPFDPNILVRPGPELELASLIGRLPLPMLSPYLPFLVVVVFLFVIVVMI
ncbi:MAG: CvpA family protein [Chloroflexi bacterium]|nr:MAG: CvpA family protein [Chloroflexota bacterium]